MSARTDKINASKGIKKDDHISWDNHEVYNNKNRIQSYHAYGNTQQQDDDALDFMDTLAMYRNEM